MPKNEFNFQGANIQGDAGQIDKRGSQDNRQPAEITSKTAQGMKDRAEELEQQSSRKADENHAPKVNEWYLFISGFLQHKGKPNGITQLWHDVRHQQSGPRTVVETEVWNMDAGKYAEIVWRFIDRDNSRIVITGYSWGGYTALKLCRALKDRGIIVDELILVDAVFRFPLWIGRFTAFMPFIPIKVPSNVAKITWFTQKQNLPRGHKVKTAATNTELEPEQILEVNHQYIDDHPKVRESVLEIIGNEGTSKDETG